MYWTSAVVDVRPAELRANADVRVCVLAATSRYHGRFSHGLIEGYGSLDVKGDRERLLQNGVVNPHGIYQYVLTLATSICVS